MIRLQGKSRIMSHDETLWVSRRGPASWVDGKRVLGEIDRFQAKCNVQPLNGRDLLIVPEGDRTKEMYWMWQQLPCTEGKPVELNDVVEREGKKFQLQTVEPWGSYVRAKMVAIDTGPEENQS